jgi:ABC-type multidrug transport system fused ATPase/permease subunit
MSPSNNLKMTNQASIINTFLSQNKRAVTACFLLDFAANLLTLVLPLLASVAFSLMAGHSSARGAALTGAGIPLPQDFPGLMWLFVGVLTFKAGLDFYRKKRSGRIAEDFTYWLRCQIFDQQLRLHPGEYDEKGMGRYLLRFSGDLSSVQGLVSRGILQFAADASLVALGLALIFWLDGPSGWLVSGWLLVLAAAVALVQKQMGIVETKRRNRKSGLLAFVNRRLLNIHALKALNRQGMEMAFFTKKAERLRQLGHHYATLVALQDALLPFTVFGLAGAVLLSAWSRDEFTGNLFAVMMVLLTWRPVLQRLLRVGMVWKKGGISLHNIAGIFRLPIEAPTGSNPVMKMEDCLLVFKHLNTGNFTFSACLKIGETGLFALSGHAEKENLLRLIAGLKRPPEGQFFLGETDVAQLDLKKYRQQITIASPIFPLYGDTIGEALANSSRKAVWEKAARELDNWKRLFPELQTLGFDTPLTETATNLNPAQHGLLLLLRSLLTDKPFLVVEGVFKHFTPETAAALLGILQSERRRRGLLFVGFAMSDVVLPGMLADWTVQQAMPKQLMPS